MFTLAELAIKYRQSKESKDIQKKLDTLVDETYNEIINDWILNSEKGKFKVIGIAHISSTICKIITTKIQSLALPDINCYDISILADRVCSKLDNDYRVCGYRGASRDEIKKVKNVVKQSM